MITGLLVVVVVSLIAILIAIKTSELILYLHYLKSKLDLPESTFDRKKRTSELLFMTFKILKCYSFLLGYSKLITILSFRSSWYCKRDS